MFRKILQTLADFFLFITVASFYMFAISFVIFILAATFIPFNLERFLFPPITATFSIGVISFFSFFAVDMIFLKFGRNYAE